MEITGRIIAVLPVQGGISKNGNEWKKQEYVLETHDQYPKKYASRFSVQTASIRQPYSPEKNLQYFLT